MNLEIHHKTEGLLEIDVDGYHVRDGVLMLTTGNNLLTALFPLAELTAVYVPSLVRLAKKETGGEEERPGEGFTVG